MADRSDDAASDHPDAGFSLSRRTFIGAAGAGAGAVTFGLGHLPAAAVAPATAGPLRLTALTTEYAPTLLGTDVARPRLAWIPTATGHGAVQTGYQVLVASAPELLEPGRADVWDSGRVESAESAGIEYGGPELAPRTRYHWRARLWDGAGRGTRWSEPAWFETGLRAEGFGAARWIGAEPDPAEQPRDVAGASWIWRPGATADGAPTGPAWFRGRLTLPAGVEVTAAHLVMTADDDYTAYLQGEQVLHAPEQVDGWKSAEVADVTALVSAAAGGELVLAAAAHNRGAVAINPGGLLAKLVVTTAAGDQLVLVTDGSWRSAGTEEPGWQQPGHDDSGWDDVAVLAPYGQGPWGDQVTVPQRETLDLLGASWVWTPDATPSGAPEGTRWFRGRFPVPAGVEVTSAELVMTADDDFTAFLDGDEVLTAPQQSDGWRSAKVADVTDAVAEAAGRDLVLAARATNRPGPSVNPAGLIAKLLVHTAGGDDLVFVTDDTWRGTDTEQPGWEQPGHDDSGWPPVAVLAPYGQGPWGDGVVIARPERPAPLLRRAFALAKPVSRARLYASGVAYHDLHLNGVRVGDSVLDPGFTAYDQTVLYVTHDVTELLRSGDNVLGAELGRGFYGMTTDNVWRWHQPPWHGEPRLLARLVVEHPDGSSTEVVSDPDWRVSDGPTVSNSLFAGESYDARLVPDGWTEPGFDDAEWAPAASLDPPGGAVTAQENEPMRVIEDVAPVRLTEPLPGTWVADFGRTTAGWSKLRVTAPAGTTIRLRHGETVAADGTVNASTGHVPGRFQTDEYTTRGGGEEVWEPKFSYKGFRYVQIDGLPSAPDLQTVTMRVVHSDVPEVTTFESDQPMYEQLEGMMRRTVLNNLHSIPTDTPMYEKNGWTGDAQVGAPTMAETLDMARFFTKWLGDLRDSQIGSGQIPVIVPSGGWGYQELAPAPEWTTVYPFVLREMYRWYGDRRILAEHWEPVLGYLDWELGRLQDGLAVTALGDYLSPGTGGNPPEDTRLTATAYLHRSLLATAEVGDLLGHDADAARLRTAADGLRTRLNETFLDTDQGLYRTDRDPHYRQTSNAVPLAFGLVPPEHVDAVVASLVADVEARGWHLNTGCLGTSVLLPVLTAHGHADAAAKIALQRTQPSWGHWIDNGADTMWEMWQVDTRSRNHYFHGTVVQWLFEHVAGLVDLDEGWRRFRVRPDARSQVGSASLSTTTVRGRTGASWTQNGRSLRLTVVVPVGSTAEVWVPAESADDVTAAPSRLVTDVRSEPGWAVYTVGAGEWRFDSRSAPVLP